MKKEKNIRKTVVGGTVVTSLFLGGVFVGQVSVLNGNIEVDAYEFVRKEDVSTLKKDENGNIKKLEEVKYLVIHETANESEHADAEAHYNLVDNDHDDYIYSYAFVVDENKAIQMAPIDARTTHTKSGNGITNNNAIGIEMCVNKGANYEETVKNTIKLIRDEILPVYPDIEIVQHYDAYGKDCPSKLRKSGRWNDFIDAIYDKRKTEVVLGWEEEVVQQKTTVDSATANNNDTTKLTKKEKKLKEKEGKVNEIETLLLNKEEELKNAENGLSIQKEDKIQELNNLEKEEIKKIEDKYNKQIKELEDKMKSEVETKSNEFDKKESEEIKKIEEDYTKNNKIYQKEIEDLKKDLEKAQKEYEKQIDKNKSIIEKITDIFNVNKEETVKKQEVKETVVKVVENENIDIQKKFQTSLGVTPEVVETKEIVGEVKTEEQIEEKEETKSESKGLLGFLFKSKELYNVENVLIESKVKKKDLERALREIDAKDLVGFAETFVEMEDKYGFNAIILTAMAINDSKKDGNLYNSDEKIEEMVNKIVNKYINLDKNAQWLYIGSSNLKDIGSKYAPNNNEWIKNILNYSEQIKEII